MNYIKDYTRLNIKEMRDGRYITLSNLLNYEYLTEKEHYYLFKALRREIKVLKSLHKYEDVEIIRGLLFKFGENRLFNEIKYMTKSYVVNGIYTDLIKQPLKSIFNIDDILKSLKKWG